MAIKLANAGISPMLHAALRSAGGFLLIVGYARFRGVPLFAKDGTLLWGSLAGLLFGVEFLFLYNGLVHTSASRGVVFFYTMPFFTALGAHFLLPNDRLTTLRTLGLVTAFAGVALAVLDGALRLTPAALMGDFFCLIAGALWAATIILVKATPLVRAAPEKNLLYQLGVSAPLMAGASLVAGEAGVTDPAPVVLGALAFQIVIVVFITYTAWFWLISRYPASRIAGFSFLTPVFGVLAGVLVLGEPLGLRFVAALALVALGIWLVNRPPPHTTVRRAQPA